jgi:MFS family permease
VLVADAVAAKPGPEAATDRPATPRRPRIYHGWWIVLCSWLGDFFATGITMYTFGLFFKPMGDELGWSRGAISFAFTLRALVTMALGPVAGRILDRWGPRLLMGGGALVAGASLLALSQVHTLLQFYLVFGILWSIGFTTMGGMVTTTVVAKWFVRIRGRAIAIAVMGISTGGMLLVQLSAFVIRGYGWRTAWIVLGLLVLAIVVPLALLLMRRQPEDMGLRPDGDSDASPAPTPAGPRRRWRLPTPRKRQERDWTLREAIHTPALWLLVVASNLSGLAMSTVTLHQVPLLQDRGLSLTVAAGGMTFFAMGSLTAKVIWGVVADYVPLRYLAALNFLGSAGIMGLLFSVNSASAAFIYGGVAGFIMGANPVVQSLLWPEYFGRAALGTIRGALMPLSALSSGFGPYLGGVLFDRTRSYGLLLAVLIGAAALAGLLILLARPPQAPASIKTGAATVLPRP